MGQDHASVLRRALTSALTGDVDTLDELVTDDVAAWSPNMVTRSRRELAGALWSRDEVLTEIEVTIDALDVVGNKAIAEWRAAARFSVPFLLQEDLLIEPTGARVQLAGVTVAEFRGNKIRSLRSYFDDSALLEQMLALT